MKQATTTGPFRLFVTALAGLSLLSVGFFVVGSMVSQSFADWYLVWNLFLAWIPLCFSYALIRLLRRQPWSSWGCIGLSLAWLLFLPNSFYMVSDFIHLQDTIRGNVLFDSLLFTLFILNGLILGYTSLYLVQHELRKRVSALQTSMFVGAVLFSCSFAIYLGRDLRWNSWDVLVSPAGILFDISERIVRPLAHPQAFSVTLMFFVFLAGLYWVVWKLVKAIRTVKV
jgi:uncharacterized membrane protein